MTSARRYKSVEPRRSAASAAVPAGGVRPPAPYVRSLSRRECEALLARNVVGRIAFAHRGRVDIAPTNYVYTAGWLFARADAAMRTAINQNRWVAVEVAEVSGVSDWQSVVVHGACYTASPTGSAAADAAIRRGTALLLTKVPAMSRSRQAPAPFPTTIFRVHVDELTGWRATSSRAPLRPVSIAQRLRRAGSSVAPPESER